MIAAKDTVIVDDDVADVDTDSKCDLLRHPVDLLSHPVLHLNGARNSIDDASELDEHAVASGLHDAG
jgi:hypothetical protein